MSDVIIVGSIFFVIFWLNAAGLINFLDTGNVLQIQKGGASRFWLHTLGIGLVTGLLFGSLQYVDQAPLEFTLNIAIGLLCANALTSMLISYLQGMRWWIIILLGIATLVLFLSFMLRIV